MRFRFAFVVVMCAGTIAFSAETPDIARSTAGSDSAQVAAPRSSVKSALDKMTGVTPKTSKKTWTKIKDLFL